MGVACKWRIKWHLTHQKRISRSLDSFIKSVVVLLIFFPQIGDWSGNREVERAATMAVPASDIISYSIRTLSPPTPSCLKLQARSKFTILGFPSLFQQFRLFHSPSSISPSAFPVAKAASSVIEGDDYKNSPDSATTTSSSCELSPPSLPSSLYPGVFREKAQQKKGSCRQPN